MGLAMGAAPGGDVTAPSSGVDPAHLPSLALRSLPLITELTAEQCPELPPVWVVAQVEAESGWDPAASGGGVAGLLHFDELTWMAAGAVRDACRAALEEREKQGGGELTVKGIDGQIRSKDTIPPGRDPFPPRG